MLDRPANSPAIHEVFSALGDPVRLAIVDELIAHNGQTLFELVLRLSNDRGISLSRQAVSKHIAVLSAAGVLVVNRQGRTSIHTIERERLESLRSWLEVRADHLAPASVSHSGKA